MRASTMQLERREAIELVLSSRGSLLLQVARASHHLILKRLNLKKVTKDLGSDFETP